MFYHASPVPNLSLLEPHISNHGMSQVYFSSKRENVLVYLSNAVEKYCRETLFAYDGPWQKWASYGFREDGRLRLEEYWPNATWETYKGVSGYIYLAESNSALQPLNGIRDAFVSSAAVPVSSCEFIPDAYDAIMEAVEKGLITHVRYDALSEGMLRWLADVTKDEYRAANTHPEYRHFLKGKFASLL